MRHTAMVVAGALLLAGCVAANEPAYEPTPVPFYSTPRDSFFNPPDPYPAPPRPTFSEPEPFTPTTPAPLPPLDDVTLDLLPSPDSVPEGTSDLPRDAQVAPEPTQPAPPPPPAATAAPVVKPKPGSAVPLMGFRPMRGQSAPGI